MGHLIFKGKNTYKSLENREVWVWRVGGVGGVGVDGCEGVVRVCG